MNSSNQEVIEISFRGSMDKLNDAIQNMLQLDMLQLGFIQINPISSRSPLDDSIPWREVFPEMTRTQENGIALKETRKLLGVTQKQLAELTGIPQRHISEMETAKRPIGKETAKKFAHVLDVNYRLFL